MDRSFDTWDNVPNDMRVYLQNYGFNFSENMCKWAVSMMKDKNGKVNPIGKDKFNELMTKYGIELKNDNGFNGVYTLNMAKSDYYGSSIQNEQQLALFVKDFIDDLDADVGSEKPFRYFFAMCMGKGVVINWGEML